MEENLTLENEQPEEVQLYSKRAILVATYLSGPLTPGILMRQNFINLGEKQSGKNVLIIAVISSILMFAGIFSIPDDVMEKIPKYAIPFIYTGIVYFLLEKYQGKELKKHKNFYSGWKVFGVSAICFIILMAAVLSCVFLWPKEFDSGKYNNGIEQFGKNEETALQYFSIEEDSIQQQLQFLENVGIPMWEKNVALLNSLDSIKGLSSEFLNQNEILKEYSNLRMQSYTLIKKSLEEDTGQYDNQIQVLSNKIDEIINQLYDN